MEYCTHSSFCFRCFLGKILLFKHCVYTGLYWKRYSTEKVRAFLGKIVPFDKIRKYEHALAKIRKYKREASRDTLKERRREQVYQTTGSQQAKDRLKEGHAKRKALTAEAESI
uniref:Uncharacterized protein n=1 Tax=Rhodosorus marinus TaxID=101924 RepID=A0A7S3E9T3_9RHOD|mmetsp:Transcript_2006/g.7948  ORF Transcript_2006/g.7948 Transcript_2006/m.7948 type:complete len:113 (+) Transcript_2006:91-429(+)